MFFLIINLYIYYHLVKDIYKFVDKFRKVNISKNEEIIKGDAVVYYNYNKIRDYIIYNFSDKI